MKSYEGVEIVGLSCDPKYLSIWIRVHESRSQSRNCLCLFWEEVFGVVVAAQGTVITFIH